jgi:hypothetical protein
MMRRRVVVLQPGAARAALSRAALLRGGLFRVAVFSAAVCGATLFSTAPLAGQESPDLDGVRRLLRLEATPIGALPPLPLPMPASRDRHYWMGRIQTGYRYGRGGADLFSVAGGVDLQWHGGSSFGVTVGYQQRDCAVVDGDCGGHPMASVGTRLNVLAGGPGPVASLLGDYSGTTTVGLETSFGYAPGVLDRMDACTLDLGLPISTAVFQQVRVATFMTPGVVWDFGCGAEHRGPRSYRVAAGVGILQLGHPGLDVFLGVQRIFRSGTGYHMGLSVNYVHLPQVIR